MYFRETLAILSYYILTFTYYNRYILYSSQKSYNCLPFTENPCKKNIYIYNQFSHRTRPNEPQNFFLFPNTAGIFKFNLPASLISNIQVTLQKKAFFL